MADCPSHIKELFRRRWPQLSLRWNKEANRFEIWEKYVRGASYDHRLIMPYENFDGSPLPVVADQVVDLVHRADTRKWPLHERLKIMRKQRDDDKNEMIKNFRDATMARITDDWNYINGTKTYFMDPLSMPQRMTTYTPYQERELKRMGAL